MRHATLSSLSLALLAFAGQAAAQDPPPPEPWNDVYVALKPWAEEVYIIRREVDRSVVPSHPYHRITVGLAWTAGLEVLSYEHLDDYSTGELVGEVLVIDADVQEPPPDCWGSAVGDTWRFVGVIQTAGAGTMAITDKLVEWCSQDITGPDYRDLVELPSYATIYGVPTGDRTRWRIYGAHDSIACCYELYLPPAVASTPGLDYLGLPPLDLFEGTGLEFRVFETPGQPCDGYAGIAGSYPLGAMGESYSGILGVLEAATPFDLALEPCTPGNPPAIWWDGEVPALVRPSIHWITVAGDIDGNGVVNVSDFLKLLAAWADPELGDFGVIDVLDLLETWSAQ